MKVYINGSVGSGKTTLAKTIAAKLRIPRFEIDNFVWERQAISDLRNSEKARNKQFQQAVQLPEWVIEGVYIGRTDKGLKRADKIIFLDIPPYVRTCRISKRFIKQKLKLETATYRQTLRIFYKRFGWNRYFETTMKPVFIQKLQPYQEKTFILNNQEGITALLEVTR
ncbi:DNA topology modulation protein FlaR [Planococcus shenhongbingii]|uniref:DNA topology modulation protein FlaR n=1 Tax=Planococcus shenhongbingii TaxID=3058398 RepID=UPI0026190C0F|nr:DNA topology modulation protein FlaR [Planococcus sp. N016]WKA56858.1 DNA topology modulation protein FlaR [Planococcus sp. N016]